MLEYRWCRQRSKKHETFIVHITLVTTKVEQRKSLVKGCKSSLIPAFPLTHSLPETEVWSHICFSLCCLKWSCVPSSIFVSSRLYLSCISNYTELKVANYVSNIWVIFSHPEWPSWCIIVCTSGPQSQVTVQSAVVRAGSLENHPKAPVACIKKGKTAPSGHVLKTLSSITHSTWHLDTLSNSTSF